MKHAKATALLAGSYLLVGSSPARASDWPNVGDPGTPVVSVGGLFSYTGRTRAAGAVGAGVEASFALYPWMVHSVSTPPPDLIWLGAVTQVQVVADRPVHERVALGFQGGYAPLGVEISAYTEGAGPSNGRTYGAQFIPFVSIAVAYAGFRLALPFNARDGAGKPSYGTEYGLVIGLKFPINPRASFIGSMH